MEDCGAVTPYERLLQKMELDDRCREEVALGKRVGFYRFRGDLGAGNFSRVKTALHCLTKDRVAVKVMETGRAEDALLDREIANMSGLEHPNVVRLFEVVETPGRLFLVMEHCAGGELFALVCTQGRLPDPQAAGVVAQVASALQYLHNRGIVHRDLKAENVFLTTWGTVKVGDFGFSKWVARWDEPLRTFCGSPPYAAPELFSADSYVGPLVDIWALGVLAYFVATAAMPFRAASVAGLREAITAGDFTVPEFLSPSCESLIRSMLQPVPESRPGLDTVLSSEWLTAAGDVNVVLPSTDPELEEEAMHRLELLGISREMLDGETGLGIRSPFHGTYSLILHRLQNPVPLSAPPKPTPSPPSKGSKACQLL
ncbi:NIM1K [Cordylochernes scorpioides]|uniref:NIM1K n=1 Tax=Cordylochernes scorpioides TaxID=51811 RepID=A0ABY6KD40_9ARAC|nr:NIM1K [Cordylochernes scorpioides]